ncbi:hypothetical protein MF271_10575 [Deinococcus sp. KNUC1210]|uniref:hypothetical protein n=1 Tax=Deinococcus sp. KNUC1210 TaxID=2917691 RepID=UPI001EF01101|nr:hypothetical protein [Deinococcus sp. KNUC1210]ULH14478.1 hypothetical protein MF271_10575 [Deinococcus sp. KNUC1210]
MLVPAGQPASQVAPVADLIHLGVGWRAVLADLDGPGRRWLVTPWLTTREADLLGLVQLGDRLLIRGNAEDFLSGTSKLEAVQAFQEWGVEVRRMPTLHAKVYAREQDGHGHLWLGSANLSGRGEHGHGWHHSSLEAMSGPHPLTAKACADLESLWANSKPFSVSDVQRELERLVEEREKFRELLLGSADLGVLALRLSFRLLGGQLTISPDWLGHANEVVQKDRVKYPSVEFIDPETSLASRFRAFMQAEKRKLNDLLEDVPGTSGLYVLRVEDKLKVTAFLSTLEQRARDRFDRELKQEHDHLCTDFTRRFQSAFARFLTESRRGVALNTEQAALQATKAFKEYISRDPFKVSAQFFLPW